MDFAIRTPIGLGLIHLIRKMHNLEVQEHGFEGRFEGQYCRKCTKFFRFCTCTPQFVGNVVSAVLTFEIFVSAMSAAIKLRVQYQKSFRLANLAAHRTPFGRNYGNGKHGFCAKIAK